MEFCLINYENQTETILQKLEQFGFSKIKITRKEYLTFVEINDTKYNSFISRETFEDEYQMCLQIYKMFDYKNSIDIPMKIIQSIYSISME